jgi:hypothetical protein
MQMRDQIYQLTKAINTLNNNIKLLTKAIQDKNDDKIYDEQIKDFK